MRYFSGIFILILFVIIPAQLPGQALPQETSTLFSGSGNCTLCHLAGTNVFRSATGADVSPITLWQSSMMANASKDPVWQAKVTAEVNAHPALQVVIEDKCATCHMPLGRTEAVFSGQTGYTFAAGLADPLSLDGVSCTLCHQIQAENLGDAESYSGGYLIQNKREIYGPFPNPLTMQMQNNVGYTPVMAEHIRDSRLCATCHTLFTPFVDNDGQVAGYFPEQVPYFEWENSEFPANGQSCQTCHLPLQTEPTKLSTRPANLATLRNPIGKHELVGGNVFVNQMLQNNLTEIGATTTTIHLEQTRARMLNLLQNQTLEMDLEADFSADTLMIEVSVKNLAGHKFPTGFPGRRAWLYLVVRDNAENTIFESGNWNSEGEINGLNDGYEPHYSVITEPTQVQIYEATMQDVDQQVTYTLLRGSSYVKDNRLPPRGFSRTAENYQDISIVGHAASDADFSPEGTGSGEDLVHYRVPVSGAGDEFKISLELRYQTLAPRFLADLFQYQTPQVTQLKNYTASTKNTPVLLQKIEVSAKKTGVTRRGFAQPACADLMPNYPNPFNSQTLIKFQLPESGRVNLTVCNILGQEIRQLTNDFWEAGSHSVPWNGQDNLGRVTASGIYLLRFQTGDFIKIRKIAFVR